jgi:hypothetical protein
VPNRVLLVGSPDRGVGRGSCCFSSRGGFLALLSTGAALLTLPCPACLSVTQGCLCACLSEAAAEQSSS